MGLITYDSIYRRTWMFPRNIRLIFPWKIAQIISLLQQQAKSSEWSGNQAIQNQFIRALELSSLKRVGVQYDPHSGGARTYISQLESLGLVFKRDNGQIYLTIAGEDMVKGYPPLPILQSMLLRHQYPSVYSNGSNVKIHPAIRVKPFLFILELISKAEYMTYDEMVIPVVYGHNTSCIQICLDKIYKLRNGASLESVIDSKDDLYTPRTSGRSFACALQDVRDIANTCKNYLKGGCLVNIEKIQGTNRISIADEFRTLIENELKNKDEFISGRDSEEAFQRKFGCYNRSKDNRNLAGTDAVSPAESIISSQFFSYLAQSPVSSYPKEFVDKMTSGYGFSRDLVEKVIYPILPQALSFFESTYIDISKSGGAKAIEFEKATGKLFADKFKFKVRHTGQMRRPDGAVGAYADLFIIALDDLNCAIIDTKSTPAYSLSSPDFHKVAYNYISNYGELTTDKTRKLEFFSFIAGGFKGDVNSRLRELHKQSGTPVSAISAVNLLHACNSKLSQEDLRKSMAKSKLISHDELKTGAIAI